MAFALACTTWKSQRVAPQQVVTAKRPDHVRVLLADSTQLELWKPRISGDSLVGRLERTNSTRLGGIPLSDIKQLQIRRLTTGGTIVVVVASVGLAALLVAGVAAAVSANGFLQDGNGGTTSCPVIYSWDGHQWRLDSGTFGGAIMPALSRTDIDNLASAATVGDTVRLRVANQARETDYLDYLAVLAIDHRPGVAVIPDAQGRLQTLVAPVAPANAVDFRGRDALPRVLQSDGWAWESVPTGRDSSRAADVRDGLELSFRRPPDATRARLLIDASNSVWAQFMMQRFVGLHGTATQAWYDSVAADRRLAQRIGEMMVREVYLGVAVKVDGRWERRGIVREAGPEISKQQIVPLDLSGVTGDTVTVRLESAPSLWLVDRVAIDYSAPESFTARESLPIRAIDHDGRDVRGLVNATDRREYVMERGDGAELTFAVPPVPTGLARSYVLVTRGWYRLDLPGAGEPQSALLERALNEPLAASRLITGDLERATTGLNRE
jgi:hypothetical protein